ncbi:MULTISPECIES: tRNA preQ1(34) S-adenosylmethionine ribosyltransferase-isomerase QueA [Campylobacter]|uniref:tRNA preQ1(34) S-adenosylmethionine ribosyltransferase-isomerase QueA n=1 Tax=Campylobacter TaxID=194 RepID=UPI000A33A7E1|nr:MULTISPECIES: tRNA preQ1(34) S-adenosylmethionine ribosyltransferase-isomerase QueA [unclassified Campylobacter]MBE6430088.1 tRNA preQ1(34) S-adenosylmethionine ribosyltransferase-isomerase QueA [Campylobacter sp.]
MKNNIFDLDSYDYELPSSLIASSPANPKESANLLVYQRSNNKITHTKFGNLMEFLPDCDIIFNDTKVIKARIYGKKSSGGAVELLLNQPLGQGKFSTLIKGRVKAGAILEFDNGLSCEVIELLDEYRIVKFYQNNKLVDTTCLYQILNTIGHVPLPPYIKREDQKSDEIWYQSIFAKNDGAVAAPTASLHFSPQIIQNLKSKHNISYITLHVGAGTFKGVEVSDIREHKMHSEIYTISDEAINTINSNKPILGVGTTVTRCIEYFYRTGVKDGLCDLFLHPANPPQRQNYLLTNFHLPKSTLIMLVASFVGLDNIKEIYKQAIEKNYKFYSYGDAMLVI